MPRWLTGSAPQQGGATVSVIVESDEEALKKIAELREDGFVSVTVRDMHGLDVDIEDLQP